MFSYVMTYNLYVLLWAYASSCCVQQLSQYSNFHNSQNTMQAQHSAKVFLFFYLFFFLLFKCNRSTHVMVTVQNENVAIIHKK